jgi:hypothetical protein
VLAACVALLVRARMGSPRAVGGDLGPLAVLLAAVQVVAFVGQEVIERLVSSAPLGDLVHQHVLAIGVVVQIGIGVLGAVALRWLTRAADRVASASIHVRLPLLRPALVAAPPATSAECRGRVAVSTPGVRAPPPSDVFPAN